METKEQEEELIEITDKSFLKKLGIKPQLCFCGCGKLMTIKMIRKVYNLLKKTM